uniref:Condensation domain-containing protein n=1 Tax=Bionectria ochroleuca TaxID=29856 RepID=A0A8H7K8Y7_BIOOC
MARNPSDEGLGPNNQGNDTCRPQENGHRESNGAISSPNGGRDGTLPVEMSRENSDGEAMAEYWRNRLENATPASFPPRASGAGELNEGGNTKSYGKTVDIPQIDSLPVQLSTLLQAAWAMVMSRHSDSEDVTLGYVLSARDGEDLGMAGSTAVTVPMRLHLLKEESALRFLQSVENQSREIAPFAKFGIKKIAKVSQDAEASCAFTSLMAIQRIEDTITPEKGAAGNGQWAVNEFSSTGQSLLCQCLVQEGQIHISLKYRSDVIGDNIVCALAHHYESAIQGLAVGGPDVKLGDISLAGSWDVQQATVWNQARPETTYACWHDKVEEQAEKHPTPSLYMPGMVC